MPTFTVKVEEGKIREFASATHCVGEGSDVIAPPTFLTSSVFWMQPSDSVWHGVSRDLRHVLHGEQSFDYPSGPPRAGDVLSARQRIGGRYVKHGASGELRFTEVITDFRAIDGPGRSVATMTSVTIEKSLASDVKASPAQNIAEMPADVHERFVAPPLTVTDCVRYQGASGDFNPLHHDVEFAHAGGYHAPVVIGMLSAGVAVGRAVRGRRLADVRGVHVRWASPAFVGDVLTYDVVELGPSPDASITGCELIQVSVYRPGGARHLTLSLTMAVS